MSVVANVVTRALAASGVWGGRGGGNGGNGGIHGVWGGHSPAQPAISHEHQVGGGWWGTLHAPRFPGFLGRGYPNWGGRNSHTNYYDDVPDTGVTRYYDFTIDYGNIAPDGVEVQGILINGQFPAPPIEANWGDMIQVTVHNKLGNEGTALHWHGLLQKNTQWEDGVPSVSMCPIAPGASHTYFFQADLYGTSWYHSHYSAQYASGAVGPLIIYGPNSTVTDYDIDVGPVMISDWYHREYYELVQQTMAPISENQLPPQSDNILINGMMNYDCSQTTMPCTPNAGVAKFAFTSGKKHRLRLINTGAEAMLKFSIDGHKMTIIANDYVPIEPYEVTSVTLGIGQRTDVIVEADGSPDSVYWVRASAGPGVFAGGCNFNNPKASEALAVIYYEDSDKNAVPTTEAQPDAEMTSCANDALSLTKPV
ncbi:hypothetical protein LTS18_009988, partial [Coniosporium uncinatum]